MAPPTLVSMTQRNLIRNLPGLQDVGDVSYDLVKPALRKIVDPQQLRNIEIASPHIAEADSELWLAFIKRDVQDWKKKIVAPTDPRNWWKVYRKLYREEKAEQEAQQKQLEEALKGKQKEKEGNTTRILNTVVQQRFAQKAMVDGNINPNAGAYGIQRVGSVAHAKRSGKNIIAAICKASSERTKELTRGTTWAAQPTQTRMWQKQIIPPGTRRKQAPNLLGRTGAPTMAEKATQSALSRALKADERIREKRARRASDSPPALKASNLAANVQSGRRQALPTQPSAQGARSIPTRLEVEVSPAAQKPSQVSPPRVASPAAMAKTTPSLGSGAGSKPPLSPQKASPAPPQKRQRPSTSIFIPSKRVKR